LAHLLHVFFHFPTSPIKCRYFILANCRDLNISKKINKVKKISQKDAILIIKISVCQRDMVHKSRWVNFPTRAENLEASTVCWRESANWRVHLPSNHASAADRVRRLDEMKAGIFWD